MMKKTGLAILSVTLLLAVTISVTAYAATGYTKTATLTYSGISVVLDGKQLSLTDATGKTVEPFVIDGTTYLPVRAISDALGLDVQWNGDSNTVYLSTEPIEDSTSGKVVDMSTLEAYSGEGDFISAQSFMNRQEKYSPDNMLYAFAGESILGWTLKDVPTGYSVTYLLNGDFTTLKVNAASIDGQGSTTFIFQDGDTMKELKKVSLASGDKPVELSIDVTGIDKLRIYYSVSPHKFNNSGYYYIEPNGALYNAYLVE
ncbi:stalk domain-containing protein [Ruminiclostridium sufflavum]|nr:stalk domain-containing protein [Ruminiclostridium sufflavum]